MSRSIKTFKCLQKHLGKTVHIINEDGTEFNAQVESNGEDCLVLHTEDKIAEEATGWLENRGGWSHFCRVDKPYQITEELKSIALVKEKKPVKTKKKPGRKRKTTKTFVSAKDLKANEGHYCEMADGTTGFIAGSKYLDHVCVIHNSEGPSEGWDIEGTFHKSEIKGVSKSFLKKFSKGWHVGEDYEAEQVKVVEILIKAGKPKKAKRKLVTLEDLKKNIGHCCTFKSGDKGYICESTGGNLLICFNTQQNGYGWEVDKDVPENLHKHFKYARFLNSSIIEDLGIVSIDSEPCELQDTVSKKPFLSREQLLEHIGKRCKMSDGTEGLIVKTGAGNPRILMKSRVNGHGWPYVERMSEDSGAPSSVKSRYKYAWNVTDLEDAEDISVVEILEDDSEKPVESSKTILDMTIREVLEKLDEIIKR